MSKRVKVEEIKVLNETEVISRLKEDAEKSVTFKVHAYYSSAMNGVVVDPHLMVINIDDKLVNRGHSVFDTCNIVNGYVYGVSPHLDRAMDSCKKAKINLKYTKEELKALILKVAKLSKQKNAYIRFWISKGRGDFNIFTNDDQDANIFIVVTETSKFKTKEERGIIEALTTVETKNDYLATLKSTNYLMNALTTISARGADASLGLLVNGDKVAEFSIAGVIVLTKDGVLKTPKLDRVLKSITISRLYDRKEELKPEYDLIYDDITKEELLNAKEIIQAGGSKLHWVKKLFDANNNKLIWECSTYGKCFEKLDDILFDDMNNVESGCLDLI